MTPFRRVVLALLLVSCAYAAVRAIVPAQQATETHLRTPGVFAGNYLYVSGQDGRDAAGRLPGEFEAQAKQALDKLKNVVETAGLTLQNVVYTQVYLTDTSQMEAMDRVYAGYFPNTPPARATLGVAALPGGSSVQLTAVAVKDAAQIKPVVVPGLKIEEPFSAGILTNDRLFISGVPAKTGSAEQQVTQALDNVKSIVEAAGLTMAHVVFVNPFLTTQIPSKVMNRLYAQRFEFGNTPGRATIEVSSLPHNAQIEFTGVAVREKTQRLAVRPKNMPPSPTASPCVFAGDTLYCSAKSGFIPGPNSGVFTPDVTLQLRQTMRNLLDNLEEAGLTFDDVVSTTVWLDNLADTPAIDQLYPTYFHGILPARTTIEQLAPITRGVKGPDKTYPEVEQISLIAVKPQPK